ncbi:MAG TPA: DUF721 domain-containing protein [Acetobacteraceae bacterium]|nr:DUF721 domain-containing protein [Acetobacteraceae bacterium]
MGKRDVPTAEDWAARRTFVALPLAQLVPPLTRASFKRRSPAGVDLMTEWSAIVGPRLAAETAPRRFSRGQLTIACSGPVAMELQHAAAALAERINAHLGTRLVERVRFTQLTSLPPVRVATPAMAPIQKVEGLPPGPLNDALGALRARMLGKTRR